MLWMEEEEARQIAEAVLPLMESGFQKEQLHKKYMTAEELQNSAFIISDQDYGVESRSVLEKLHLNANSTITATDDAGLVAMASAGLGFCILGRLVLKGTTSPVNVYSFHPRQFRHIALLQKKNVALSPAAEIFQKHIISYASSYPNPAIPFNF